MEYFWHNLIKTDASSTTLLIRLIVGSVFLSEGMQKILYPAARGADRFEDIGFPAPEFFGPFVGGFKIIAGLLILAGLATQLGSLITFTIMLVAIIVAKIPILFGESFGPFEVRGLSTYSFWSMAHEMRTDWAMLLGSIFLLIKGGGRWSLDQKF